jgi:hypothetical protein
MIEIVASDLVIGSAKVFDDSQKYKWTADIKMIGVSPDDGFIIGKQVRFTGNFIINEVPIFGSGKGVISAVVHEKDAANIIYLIIKGNHFEHFRVE